MPYLITIHFSKTMKLPAVTDLQFLMFKYYFEKFVSFCSILLDIFHIDTFICVHYKTGVKDVFNWAAGFI